MGLIMKHIVHKNVFRTVSEILVFVANTEMVFFKIARVAIPRDLMNVPRPPSYDTSFTFTVAMKTKIAAKIG